MSEQPGDGGVGHSWFSIEVVSVPVEPAAPAQGGGDGGGGFTSPVVPRPIEFRFRGRLRGPKLEPITARFSATTSAVRTIETILPGRAHAVKQVAFMFAGQREPAYVWQRTLEDDDELLMLLYSR